jgi:ABC-type sugar transport system substrate-binding protein
MTTRQRKLSLFLTDGANDFMHALAKDTRAAAARRGFTLDVAFSDNQAVQQIQQIYAALHAPEADRPDSVLVVPVHDTPLERVARSAAAAGIGWMCLHRATGDLDTIRAGHPGVPIGLVTPDQEEIGRLQGQKLLGLLKHGGRILYLQGRQGNSSVPRREAGLREVIRGTGIEIGDTIDGNWSVDDAERAVERWVRLMIAHVTVHAVVCQNDAMAIGARRALKNAGASLVRADLVKLPVFGCDGLAGSVAVDLIADARETGRMPPREVVLTPEPYPAGAAVRTRSSAVA